MAYRVKEVWAQKWAVTAEQMCGDNCILRMHFPQERNCIGDLVRTPKGSAEGSPDPKGLLWDVVNDRVAPLLELLRCGTWSVYVAGLGDVDLWTAHVAVTSVTDDTGGEEV